MRTMSRTVAPAPTSRLTRKGQVTIPISIRRLLGIGPNDMIAFLTSDGEVRIKPVRGVVARTAGMLRGEQDALNPAEEREAAERAIAEEAEPNG